MRELAVFMPCVPPKTTAQQKRVALRGGRVMFFHSKEHGEAMGLIDSLLISHRPDEPFGVCRVEIDFLFPFRKSEPKKNRWDGLRHSVRPDLDNYVKGFMDRLVALRFIRDDAEVWSLSLTKVYAEESGIRLRIVEEGA